MPQTQGSPAQAVLPSAEGKRDEQAGLSLTGADAAAAARTPVKARPKARRKFGISIYKAWCKQCGICAEFCPGKALAADEWGAPFVADEERCSGCLQCMHRCPDFCVEVYERVTPGAAEEGGEPDKNTTPEAGPEQTHG